MARSSASRSRTSRASRISFRTRRKRRSPGTQKYNTVPVNHFFCVDKDLADARPDVVAEIFRLLKESKAAAGDLGEIDFHPFGVEAVRKPLQMINQYSVEQKIIPRAFTADELFDDVTRKLS